MDTDKHEIFIDIYQIIIRFFLHLWLIFQTNHSRPFNQSGKSPIFSSVTKSLPSNSSAETAS